MSNQVIVVGAGPTGLCASCALRAAGVDVRTIDAAAGPATTSRALGLQPRGIEVLDRVGALGDLLQRGAAAHRSILHVNGRELAQLTWAQPNRQGPPHPLVISQAAVEAALRDRLAELGGAVEWGSCVARVDAAADDVVVHVDDGPPIHCEWVIGADGAHSVVRKSVGINFPGVPIIESFLLADVHAEIDHPRDAVLGWLRRSGPFAAFPFPDTDAWRLMAPMSTPGRVTPTEEEIVAELGARLAEETGATIQSVEWASCFRIHRRLADTYRRGRVLLAGDAAHIHSPLGGQGLNTGIGDAENLAWRLALVVTGRAVDGLLDTYEAERRPIAGDVLATTTGLTKLLLGERMAQRLVRDRIAVPVLKHPWVQRRIAEKTSQLGVSYGRRTLGRHPHPGGRVPDDEYLRADGTAVRLHAALGPAWAMIGPESLAAVAKTRLGDVVRLSGGGDAMLVRPDGHLAWRGSDPAALAAWLDTTLGRTEMREVLASERR